MRLRLKVEDEEFQVEVGKGYNDWAWLSHYAARVYSKTIYPQGTYIPVICYLQLTGTEVYPHPREKIITLMESTGLKAQEFRVNVRVRKANHVYAPEEKSWETQAFEEDRFFSIYKYSYKVVNVNRKIDFYFLIKIHFVMTESIKHFFSSERWVSEHELRLKQRELNQSDSVMEGTIKLPYGNVVHRLFYYYRESNKDEYNEVDCSESKMRSDDFRVDYFPKYQSVQQMNALVAEDMKISDNITKSLQDKQIEAKKRNANSSLCCYTFQQLWTIIQNEHGNQLCLSDYESSTNQRIKIILQKSLPSLYEIFFNYFIIEQQQRDKKEQLGITYQHVMHFLRDYQLLNDVHDLMNFIEFYNAEQKFKNLVETLDIQRCYVRFPQFVAIFFRSIQFIQTSTFLLKGESFDSAVGKMLALVVQIDSQEDEFTQFRRNMRQNPKIIAFIRTNSPRFKQLYCSQMLASMQHSQPVYLMMKEQIKRMLQSSGVTDKNTDSIVSKCFTQLKLRQDGIFYYEFLMVMQWLAIATIVSDKEDIYNDEEEALLIVDKMKFLLDKTLAACESIKY